MPRNAAEKELRLQHRMPYVASAAFYKYVWQMCLSVFFSLQSAALF